MERILLGQLGANGDCLYATILARQLRQDHPTAHITWAISSQCAPVLKNNPHIDAVWKIPIADWSGHEAMWKVFEREALRRYQRREFDHVLLSQIWPNHFENYDGTVRPSLLRSYGRPITVPIENVIELTGDEVERTDNFVRENGILDFKYRILFECSSKSGQSFVTPEKAQAVADRLYEKLPDATVIFSTHLPMELRDPRSRYAGVLTLRETARLTHFCTLFIGAGSGGTVAASSTAARPLPMLQLLAASTSVFASFAHDFEYFNVTAWPIIELTTENERTIAECIALLCREGVDAAQRSYGAPIPVTFDHYVSQISNCLLRQYRFIDAARSLKVTAERYGWTRSLVRFGMRQIAPRLRLDPTWLFSENRRFADAFRAELADASRSPAPYPRQMRRGSA
ncbi:hypothetical protein RA307_18535 [Xanthobacteraceae bacterium Astr-EGSB]|uniref:glycosyltransferase family 9 protein n=1 Tax=Astrobacterium formosum TaxID=3069710 RepID=UPI0027B1969D|nr:hypothetical protein [Xanthobacteraceae bacterium Astr-EGSB]